MNDELVNALKGRNLCEFTVQKDDNHTIVFLYAKRVLIGRVFCYQFDSKTRMVSGELNMNTFDFDKAVMKCEQFYHRTMTVWQMGR